MSVDTRVGATLLQVRDLVKRFPVPKRQPFETRNFVHAVSGASFDIARGQTLGIVGESGSGKSTTARLVLRLIEPTSGEVNFDGIDLLACGPRTIKGLRRKMQMIFQDPFGSLNPRMTILEAVGEPLEVHGLAHGREKRARVIELLETVGLSEHDLMKFPHQFSGGQAQRIGIARALATEPDLIVCDEAVSALDVSVQAQILNLLKRLQRDLGISYLFIAHDLNVVRYMSHDICVMYLGEVVEQGDSEAIFADPQHPYTRSLLEARAHHDPKLARERPRKPLEGEVPSPSKLPPGCRFHTRCRDALEVCSTVRPSPIQVGEGWSASCHLLDSVSPQEVRQ